MDPNASFNSHSSALSLEDLTHYFKKGKNANIDDAECHRMASSVTILSQDDKVSGARPQKRCECCYFPVHAELFPLTALDSLSQLGTAIPLYFYLNLHLMAMLLIVSVVAAIPATISNLLLRSESELPLTRFSIAKHAEPLPLWPIMLHLIAIILLCLVYIFMAIYMTRLMKKLNARTSRISHFAVMLKGLSGDWDDKRLKEHILENMQPGGDPITIKEVHICYNIIEFERVINRIGKIKGKEECYDKLHSASLSRIRRWWTVQMSAIKYYAGITEDDINTDKCAIIKEIDQIAMQKWPKIGVAIVVFETNEQAKAFLKVWKRGLVRRFCCCCFPAMDKALQFNGKHIYVKKAPEPEDVSWGNLKYSRLTRVRTQILAICVILVVLFFNFLVLSYVASQKAGIESKDYAKDKKEDKSKYGSCNYGNGQPNPNPNPNPVNSYSYFFANFADDSSKFLDLESQTGFANNETSISLEFPIEAKSEVSDEIVTSSNTKHRSCYADKTSMISFVIANSIFVLNFLIKLVSQGLSSVEHHHTYTAESLFIAWKLIVFQSFNMIALPLLVNMKLTDLNTEEGLAPDILHVALQTLVMPFTKLAQFVIFSLKRGFYRYWVLSGSYFSSQESLNQSFEYPDAEVAMWYVTLICNLFLTLAYTPLIPVIAPIMFISLALDFCVSKYVLLRLSSRPRPLDDRITEIVIHFVKPAIVLYGVGMFASSLRTVNDDAKKICIAALAISVAFCLIPTQVFHWVYKKIWKVPRNDNVKSLDQVANPHLNVSGR